MANIHGIYNTSLSLLTDLYQLTMAYGYFQNGIHEKTGVFNLFFRKNPFKGGYAISAGLDYVIEFLKNYKFDDSDIDYLKTLTGNDGKLLFSDEFLEYLRNMKFTCSIDAIEEGSVIFPHEPIIRVKGPLIQAQLLETTLLNIINFQTLIATKAARISLAAKGEDILEFGLRRAQGIDGGLSASRAAYLGGCSATSNVLAGKIFGIPVKGTHAHSWIMTFDTEIEAFKKYAEAIPNNSLFLVDTYNTLEGVKKAVEIGKWLRTTGHEMLGIRLDSGDLAYLSIESRKILDYGGFKNAVIVASNDLDEYLVTSLKEQGAKISVWGIGTKLVTAYDQPALGGVYKLSAVELAPQTSPSNPLKGRLSEPLETSPLGERGAWNYKIKLSEQLIKVSNPGIQRVKRYLDKDGNFIGDMIYDEILGIEKDMIVDPKDSTRRKSFPKDSKSVELLTPIFEKGHLIYTSPNLKTIKAKVQVELSKLHSGIKRFHNPHEYPLGLEEGLFDVKIKLIKESRSSATTVTDVAVLHRPEETKGDK